MLSGDFKDPLVGRDILIGAVLGGVGLLLRVLIQNFAGWIGLPPDIPNFPDGTSIGIAHLGYGLVMQFSTALYGAFLITFLLLFLTLLFRSQWIGIAAGCVILSTLGVFGEGVNYLLKRYLDLQCSSCRTFCGLRTSVWCAYYSRCNRISSPLDFLSDDDMNLTAWYAADFVIDFILLTTIAIYAFRISLAGKPVFSNLLPE